MRIRQRFFIGLLLFYFFPFSPLSWAMAKKPPVPADPANEPIISQPAVSQETTLWQCYEMALTRSETVAIEKEQIEEAEAQFYIATGDAIGEASFVMDRRRLDIQKGDSDGSSVGSTLSDPDRRERRFVINQSLFKGFKALGAFMGAGSLKGAEKEEWIRAKQLLFLDVSAAFYTFLEQQKDLETIEGIQQLLQERIEELKQREQIGRSRPSEVATAISKLKLLEAELAKAHGALEVTRHLLEFLIGVPVFSLKLVDPGIEYPPQPMVAVYLENLEMRPDVDAAKQSVKTAMGNVVVAQSGFWPELSIEHTQYERREGFQSNIDWDFLFKIDIPLFQGGDAWGDFKEARSQWKQAKLTFQLANREAELEVKQAYQTFLSSSEEAKALDEALKAAEENFKLQKEDYERNLVNNLDVLEALQSLFETKRQSNELHYQMKQNYWALQIAAGKCCEEGLAT